MVGKIEPDHRNKDQENGTHVYTQYRKSNKTCSDSHWMGIIVPLSKKWIQVGLESHQGQTNKKIIMIITVR